ncbi:retrotransposon protein, putative, ty1-copia subclass [Tanacetum coccineum]
MFVIEHPMPPALAADSIAQVLAQWNAVYDAYTEVSCLMLGKEGKPVGAYVLKMKGYVQQLERLGYVLPQDLSIGLILNGLSSDFVGFGLPKKAATPKVMAIQGGRIQKANKISLKAKGKGKGKGKGKDKAVYIPKPKNPKPSAKEHPIKDDACHYYKEVGHWKRNYSIYLAELMKKLKQVGIGLRGVRKLKQEAFYLYVGNGVRAQVEAIRSYDLVFPNRLMICLDNCHYAPTITRGVVSVSRLVDNGKMTRKPFLHRIERANNLLGLIHTDGCSPLRHVSRQGASYFITFMNDYSRYGYVYLLEHKHEVFETFKVIKNEVENQLGKTIKALRSDRGGEYITQEFKYYLKACGIVQ